VTKFAVAVAVSVLLLPWRSNADPTVRVVAADALFNEGQRLMKSGNYAEACSKLAESQDLDPAVGTQLNLAVCLRKNGQIASAWSMFLAAMSSARQAGQMQRAEYARKQALELEPQLGRLTVKPPSPRPRGFSVRVDGSALPEALWESGLPVDAGEHVVEVTAPGYEGTELRVTTTDRATKEVLLPNAIQPAASDVRSPIPSRENGAEQGEVTKHASGKVSAPRAAASPAARSDTDESSVPAATIAVGGLGLLALGVGGYFGLDAHDKFSGSGAKCNDSNICTPEGKDLRADAKTSATVATVTTGLGLGALAGAAALWFFHDSPSQRDAAPVRLQMTERGMSVRGTF
jgi:hypothetical protein